MTIVLTVLGYVLKNYWQLILGIGLALYGVHWFHKHYQPVIPGGVGGGGRPGIFSNAKTGMTVADINSASSLKVRSGLLRTKDLKLAMVSAAENEPYATAARDLVTQLVDHGAIKVTLTNGRLFNNDLVGIVYTSDDRCVNKELITAGLAWTIDCNQPEWVTAENDAKKAKRGVWSTTK